MNRINSLFSNINISSYSTQQIQIVVSRYNENLDWLLPYKNWVIIYNKGKPILNSPFKKIINIENVGRESHTYLYHIIHNWNNLSDITLFIQGKISDHDNILPLKHYLLSNQPITINLSSNKIYNNDWNRLTYNKKWQNIIRNNEWRYSKYTFGEWWDKFILKPRPSPSNLKWSPGGIFSVHKNLILSKNISFYENLINTISDHINPEEGHYFERSWFYIFS